MAINEHTLISKLSFVFFGDASALSLKSLMAVFVETSEKLVSKRTAHPTNKQIHEWFKGRPIDKLSHYKYFEFLMDETCSHETNYPDLAPERKKVNNQIRRFLRRRIRSLDDFDSDLPDLRIVQSRKGHTRLLEIRLVSDGLLEQLDNAEDDLLDERPNHPDSLLIKEKSLEALDIARQGLLKINKEISTAVLETNDPPQSLDEGTLTSIADEFRAWLLSNKPEIVDVVMRLTPASAFLGLLGMAGANMTWATPVVLAMCGGGKIVDILKGMKQQD